MEGTAWGWGSNHAQTLLMHGEGTFILLMQIPCKDPEVTGVQLHP